jgi:hypothetical protein
MWTKSWQNARPGWTRRVRWSNRTDGRVTLEFTERNADNTDRKRHRVVVGPNVASLLWHQYQTSESLTGRDIYFEILEADGD